MPQTVSRVSIIIPVFNVESYVEKCIDSVINQTFDDLEIICINDGSTDGSTGILSKYARCDNRIIIITQTNQGLSVSRNVGLEHASGEYVLFLDSDDWLEKDAIEKLYRFASDHSDDVVFFSGCTEYETEQLKANHDEYFDRAYKRSGAYPSSVSGKEMLCLLEKENSYWTSACLCLIRRGFLEAEHICFKSGILHEDILFSFDIFSKANRCSCYTDVFYHRLLRAGSIMTQEKTWRHLYGYVVTITEMLKKLQENPIETDHQEAFVYLYKSVLNGASDVWKKLQESERQSAIDKCSDRERMLFKVALEPYFETKALLFSTKQELKTAKNQLRKNQSTPNKDNGIVHRILSFCLRKK